MVTGPLSVHLSVLTSDRVTRRSGHVVRHVLAVDPPRAGGRNVPGRHSPGDRQCGCRLGASFPRLCEKQVAAIPVTRGRERHPVSSSDAFV